MNNQLKNLMSNNVDHSLKGKVVLVAGGAKNLGGFISLDLAEHGAEAVVIHFHSNESKKNAEEIVEKIQKLGCKSLAIQSDLTKPKEVTELFTKTIETFGKLDIAINTVGKVTKKPILQVTEDDFDSLFAINSKAAFFFIKEAGMTLSKGGKICTILTSLIDAYTPMYSGYSGSKASVEQFIKTASKEFSEKCISVSGISPGPMDTPFFYKEETEQSIKYCQNASALSKFTKTGLTDIKDIGNLVRFMVTDGWWVNGQTILANGGYVVK